MLRGVRAKASSYLTPRDYEQVIETWLDETHQGLPFDMALGPLALQPRRVSRDSLIRVLPLLSKVIDA